MQGVFAMIANALIFQHHSIVEIEPPGDNLLDERMVACFTCIDKMERARALLDPQSPRSRRADRAMTIVDKPDASIRVLSHFRMFRFTIVRNPVDQKEICAAHYFDVVARFVSITSQILAAISGPPRPAIARIPVGEVTLISVR